MPDDGAAQRARGRKATTSTEAPSPPGLSVPAFPGRAVPDPPGRLGPAFLGWTLPLARGRSLEIRRPLVMGILNATPDSFSDGGRLATTDDVKREVLAMVAAGADVLDVGGESTRPGHRPVPVDEEVARVVPVLRTLREVAPGIPVSIDTTKPAVARAALEAGADFVNDVSALRDPGMATVASEAGCCIVLMRNADLGPDVVATCRSQLADLTKDALAHGLRLDQIILDVGLGFGDPPGSDPRANLDLIGAAGPLGQGRPVLVGASRKRFIGTLTGVTDPAGRVAGSVAAAILAVQGGAAVVRVHDVAETVQALRILGAAPDRRLDAS